MESKLTWTFMILDSCLVACLGTYCIHRNIPRLACVSSFLFGSLTSLVCTHLSQGAKPHSKCKVREPREQIPEREIKSDRTNTSEIKSSMGEPVKIWCPFFLLLHSMFTHYTEPGFLSLSKLRCNLYGGGNLPLWCCSIENNGTVPVVARHPVPCFPRVLPRGVWKVLFLLPRQGLRNGATAGEKISLVQFQCILQGVRVESAVSLAVTSMKQLF